MKKKRRIFINNKLIEICWNFDVQYSKILLFLFKYLLNANHYFEEFHKNLIKINLRGWFEFYNIKESEIFIYSK